MDYYEEDMVWYLEKSGVLPEIPKAFEYSVKRVCQKVKEIIEKSKYGGDFLNAITQPELVTDDNREGIDSVMTKLKNVGWRSWKYVYVKDRFITLNGLISVLTDLSADADIDRFTKIVNSNFKHFGDITIDRFATEVYVHIIMHKISTKDAMFILNIVLHAMFGYRRTIITPGIIKSYIRVKEFPWNLLYDVDKRFADVITNVFDDKRFIKTNVYHLIETKLSPELRKTLVIHYDCGYSIKRTAAEREISTNKVTRELAEARKILRLSIGTLVSYCWAFSMNEYEKQAAYLTPLLDGGSFVISDILDIPNRIAVFGLSNHEILDDEIFKMAIIYNRPSLLIQKLVDENDHLKKENDQMKKDLEKCMSLLYLPGEKQRNTQ